jgi:hypothetical protein
MITAPLAQAAKTSAEAPSATAALSERRSGWPVSARGPPPDLIAARP